MKHTRPLFAFDWDDVIADQGKIRDAVRELFLLAGVHAATEALAYDRAAMEGGYNFRRQLRYILRHEPRLIGSAGALNRAYEEAMDRVGGATYPDAERFIIKMHVDFPIAIVTTGDPESQQQKVRRSGLDRYVTHMIFVPEYAGEAAADKSRALGQLLEMYPQIFSFDDQPAAINRIHAEHDVHGRIVPIRVDRKLESALSYPNIIRHFGEFDLGRWLSL